MNLHATGAYVLHLLRSRSIAGHGVHSPFMFSFITEVIGARGERHICEEVESLRRGMMADKRRVKVRDLGAGSAVMSGEVRSIRQIASAAALPAKHAALLARIAGNLDYILSRDTGPMGGIIRDPDRHLAADSGLCPGSATDHSPEASGAGDSTHANAINSDHSLPTESARLPGSATDHSPEASGAGDSTHANAINSDHSLPTESARLREPAADRDHLIAADSVHHAESNGKTDPVISRDAPHAAQGENLTVGSRHDNPVILELGTSLGISALALALGAPNRRVITVEGCPELAAIARDNLQRHGADNAEVICAEFSDALSQLKKSGTRIGMAFIDGNHRGTALIGYVNKIREMGEEMIIVADDIRMNRDMISAWESLTKDTSVARAATASLETFRLGILFFLQNLTPGLYRIKY